MACSRQFCNGLDCGLGLLGLEDMVAAERKIYASASGYRSIMSGTICVSSLLRKSGYVGNICDAFKPSSDILSRW